MAYISATFGDEPRPTFTYARARLWLGMTTVGSLVAVASLMLFVGVPEALFGPAGTTLGSGVSALAGFVVAFAAVHAIPDLVGGVLIPARFGRLEQPSGRVIAGLIRGVLVHSLGLWLIASAMLVAGAIAGLAGVMLASAVASGTLLAARKWIANAVGRVTPVREEPEIRNCTDPGFTGGIDGVLRPGPIVVPLAWREVLTPNELKSVLGRRHAAIASGSWLRGRLFALSFTLVGVAVAGGAAGPETLGTAAGIVRLSLWFTLWSFLGLLTLPTLSRWAILAADSDAGIDAAARSALDKLDRLGDDEPSRPRLIETIFHPVPGLAGRDGERRPSGAGFWDVARTALFLSSAGLGLLGRSVHCNAGRPPLWTYLPSA